MGGRRRRGLGGAGAITADLSPSNGGGGRGAAGRRASPVWVGRDETAEGGAYEASRRGVAGAQHRQRDPGAGGTASKTAGPAGAVSSGREPAGDDRAQ